MDAEGVLKRARSLRTQLFGVLMLGAFALLSVSTAAAEGDGASEVKKRRQTPALLQPTRVTIGDHNHFMGVLGPGARYLYYVTDEFNVYDLYIQSPVNSSGEPLFEAFGDIIWPAISPDGKEVAYIRYETDSRGDACRRRIKNNGKARNDREECRDTDEADLQIYWRADGRLGVLLREKLHGDHVLLDGAFEKDQERIDATAHKPLGLGEVALLELLVADLAQGGELGARPHGTEDKARLFWCRVLVRSGPRAAGSFVVDLLTALAEIELV